MERYAQATKLRHTAILMSSNWPSKSLPAPCHLQGIGVLVTRPQQQATALCEKIEHAHGRPIRLPTIEIGPTRDSETARKLLNTMGDADLVIFTSRNAVQYAFPLLPDILPEQLAVTAIGDATAAELTEYGLPPTLLPAGRFESESLLALEALQQVKDKTVIIVRGEGGRPLLGDQLTARGAKVQYAEVYQRSMPKRRPAGLISGWDQMVQCITITSTEGLDNLLTMLGDGVKEQILATPIVTISPRIAEHAKAIGCQQVLIADNASDKAILAALCGAFGKT